MNILLLGYGKMGKAIEVLAKARGHKVVFAVNDHADLPPKLNEKVDVAIEFSAPSAAFANISYCLNNGFPVLSGTTGWLKRLEEIKHLTVDKKGTFFYASNFSLGVNLFFRLNKYLIQLVNNYDYTPSIKETHHIHKLDAPSGTAITLAEEIIKHSQRFKKWQEGASQNEGELGIESIREGEVPGTHEVTYQGAYDRISITHEAQSRSGFALGAVEVAEWIQDKKGILTMDDFLDQ